MRLMHEYSTSTSAVFITLTYSDEFLPIDLSVHKVTVQLWIKRLRKLLYPRKIKYFLCGEYGDVDHRPHYHAILFNVDYSDFDHFYQNGKIYYKSSTWPYGHIHLGTVTIQSCRYVAKYMFKQLFGEQAEKYKHRLPPFRLLSQGLGKDFAIKHITQLSRNLSVRYDGFDQSLPRYYSKIYGINYLEKVFRMVDNFNTRYEKYMIKHKLLSPISYYRLKAEKNALRVWEVVAREKIKGGKL